MKTTKTAKRTVTITEGPIKIAWQDGTRFAERMFNATVEGDMIRLERTVESKGKSYDVTFAALNLVPCIGDTGEPMTTEFLVADVARIEAPSFIRWFFTAR